jgi:uncharacterized surface protein with fasciclin (FAS1) repeats
MNLKATLLWIFFFALSLTGCKKWDDHTEIQNQDLTKTLLDEISQRPDLSKFYEYLKKAGLDKELASSKTYTVWAPVNNALQNLDASIIDDADKLRLFIANHISYQSYFTRNSQQAIRVPMLNGKRVTFSGNQFDEAMITVADKFVSNGVLQVIDKIVPLYPNAWELIESTKTAFQQSGYIYSLTRKVFDPTNAIVDSINSQTGQPVYRPGTDSVLRNSFNTDIYDLENEEKQYTYFILSNAAYNAEVSKLKPYFATSTTDSTTSLASIFVVKDLVVEGVYSLDQLPATLTSKFGVKIPIDKSKIIETHKLSNGIVYVIDAINFDVKDKMPSIVIQGESYRGFFDVNGNPVTPRQNNVSAIFLRSRVNAVNGRPFIDMFAYNHGISALNAQYQVRGLPSIKYKVYWVAVNDTLIVDRTTRINPVTFNQRLAMGTRGANFLPATPTTGMAVTANNYNEVYLGDYTHSAYGTLNMYLTANASTGAGTNSLNLDYIKLVPDL